MPSAFKRFLEETPLHGKIMLAATVTTCIFVMIGLIWIAQAGPILAR